MTSRSKKYNYNISASGNFVTNNLNLGVSNMFSGSFSASNNVSSPTNVTGLSFNNSTTRYFNCQLTVSIAKTSGGNLYELFTLEANQSETGWELYETTISDITGVQFNITSSGQVQYTSTNVSNFISSTFRYSVTQITTTGTYSNLTTGTQGTYVLNSIQLTNTVGSIIGTDPGAFYVMGGSTFDKMISIRTTDNAVGFGTGGALSVYGGAAISKNLLVNGNIGIGTVNPVNNLDVTGTARITTSVTTGAVYATNSTISNAVSTNNTITNSIITNANVTTLTVGTSIITTSLLALGNSNTLGNIFTTAGNVGIGTTAPSGMLHLNGSALFTSSGNLTCTGDIISFGNLSDRRLKTDIEDLQSIDAINVVNTLRPVKFKWNDLISNIEKRGSDDIGFIAQEVEAIAPCAVDDFTDISNNKQYKCIKYERLLPYLVGSIQDLTRELQTTKVGLQKTNEELQKTNEELQILKTFIRSKFSDEI